MADETTGTGHLHSDAPVGSRADVELDLPGRHVGLFTERQLLADRAGEKRPSLEESVNDSNRRPAVTAWDGDVLTNARFAEALAPRDLEALEKMQFGLDRALDPVIRQYAFIPVVAWKSRAGRAARAIHPR